MKAINKMVSRKVFSFICVVGLAMPAFAATASNPMANIDRGTLANLLVAAPGLSRNALEHGLKAARCAAHMNKSSSPLLTIIDYSKQSGKRRMWVLDIERDELVYNEWVAHGVNSGNAKATRFSNRMNSRKTSLGVYRTAETYFGKHGYSLKLDGLDGSYNNRARERAIVIHGADYVDSASARKTGRVGRSWGCPALRKSVSRKVINTIKGGSLVVAYYPQKDWQRKSAFLNCPAATLPAPGMRSTLQIVQGDSNPPKLQFLAPVTSTVGSGQLLSLSAPLDGVSAGYYQAAVDQGAAPLAETIATYEYKPLAIGETYAEVVSADTGSYFDDTVANADVPVVESYALGSTLPTGLSYNNESYGDYSLSGVNDYSYERTLGEVAYDDQSYTGQLNDDGEVVEAVALNDGDSAVSKSSRYLRFSGTDSENVRSFSFLQ